MGRRVLATIVLGAGFSQRVAVDARGSAAPSPPGDGWAPECVPLATVGNAELAAFGRRRQSVLLLLREGECAECAEVEAAMRSAAAQLTLRYTAVRLAVANASALPLVPPPAALPAMVVVDGASAWAYGGPRSARALVSHMASWVGGDQPGDEPPHHRMVPAHLRGGASVREPEGSRVTQLTPASLSDGLGDGTKRRPHAPLALLLLYGVPVGPGPWPDTGVEAHDAFRRAAELLHARGMGGAVFSAFIGDEQPDPGSGADGGGGLGLWTGAWQAALRSVLAPPQQGRAGNPPAANGWSGREGLRELVVATERERGLPLAVLFRHGRHAPAAPFDLDPAPPALRARPPAPAHPHPTPAGSRFSLRRRTSSSSST